jgi:hypothetical protein
MTALTPEMETALGASNPLIFGALRIALPSYTLCLLDGAGTVSFNGDTYVGRDPTYGVLAGIDAIDDGVGDQAPALSISLFPPDATAAAVLSHPALQGSEVQLWLGALDRTSGAVIPDPTLLFLGELDQPTLRGSRGKRVLDYECVSAFERLFDNDEGARLADSFHKTIWPGETGLANVTGVTKKVYWGTEGAGGAISR